MLCQACRTAPVEVRNENDDENQPYAVCHACNERLFSYSLRPLEWFNLAAIHGPFKFALHDDFYNEDGTAYQSEVLVERPEDFPAPTVETAAGDLPRLIDIAIASWSIRDDVVAALGQLDPDEVLNELISRAEGAENEWVEGCCYEICARALGPHAETWIRSRYRRYPDLLWSWTQAAAACLPFDEAWSLAIAAVSQAETVHDAAPALGWFRSTRTLDWLETNFPGFHLPVTDDWGRLAAVSQLSWGCAAAWLTLGRPLSLVALDGIGACLRYDTPHLRRVQPKLILGNATRDDVAAALNAYLAKDDAPRVERAVKSILGQLDALFEAAKNE